MCQCVFNGYHVICGVALRQLRKSSLALTTSSTSCNKPAHQLPHSFAVISRSKFEVVDNPWGRKMQGDCTTRRWISFMYIYVVSLRTAVCFWCHVQQEAVRVCQFRDHVRVLRNGLLRYILHTCTPIMGWGGVGWGGDVHVLRTCTHVLAFMFDVTEQVGLGLGGWGCSRS